MENKGRLKVHRKNEELELTLKYLETLIVDISKTKKFTSSHPKIFILGCARSGTTLFTQLLAKYTDWCYPTNLLSRFYYAPYVGALIQKMLIDLDERGELFGEVINNSISLKSNLGKTNGALSPNEFWYFWNRFFKFGEIQQLNQKQLDLVDIELFNNSIYSIQEVFDKPIFMKAMNMNWHLDYLANNIPNAFFIHIKRETVFNSQSLLNARSNFFGNTNEWYSFKPPEYSDLILKTPEEQVVSQVSITNRIIENQLKKLDNKNYLSISYEDLCLQPTKVFNKMFKMLGKEFNEIIPQIQSTNVKQVDDSTWEKLNNIK